MSLLRDGSRVTGAVVRDEETGRAFDVHASRVIVCAGVWSDLVHSASGVRAGYQVRMSKGVHLVMPRSAIDADTGMIVRTSKSVLFFIPWDTRWIVGTTDTDWSGDRAEPAATAEDVDYILREANRVLARPLTRADVLAVYAGLRPLVAEAAGRLPRGEDAEKPTTKLSREHVVDTPLPGLASIAGGKFTTYRLMARDVVDAAVADLPVPVPPSVTGQLPLLGADGLPAVRASAARLASDYDVPAAVAAHLIARYGSLATEVLDLIRGDKTLGRPLVDGHPYLRAEVAYAVTHEGALHAEDVLARRVRLLIESSDAGAVRRAGGDRDHGRAAWLEPQPPCRRAPPLPGLRHRQRRRAAGPAPLPERRPRCRYPRRPVTETGRGPRSGDLRRTRVARNPVSG